MESKASMPVSGSSRIPAQKAVLENSKLWRARFVTYIAGGLILVALIVIGVHGLLGGSLAKGALLAGLAGGGLVLTGILYKTKKIEWDLAVIKDEIPEEELEAQLDKLRMVCIVSAVTLASILVVGILGINQMTPYEMGKWSLITGLGIYPGALLLGYGIIKLCPDGSLSKHPNRRT